MVQVQKGKTRERWADTCRKINEGGEEYQVPVTDKNGKVTIRNRKRKLISDGAQVTGYSILMMYSKARAKQTREIIALDMPKELQDDEIILSTNSVSLAKFRENVCSRTIRNHVRELIKVGLISQKKFHGSKSNYELVLNTDIVFGKDAVIMTAPPVFEAPITTFQAESTFTQEAQTSTAQPVFNTTFLEQKNPNFKARKNDTNSLNSLIFPHKPSLETNGNYTNTTSKSEFPPKRIQKSEESSNMETINGNPPSAITQKMPLNAEIKGGQAEKPKIYSYWSKRTDYVDKSQKSVDKSQNNVDKSENQYISGQDFEAQYPVIQTAIRQLWKYATLLLWKDREFTEIEYLKTVDLILDGFYRPFLKTKPNEKEFNEFQRELLASIDTAAKYYAKNPEKYPGSAYTINPNYLGYFDATNKRGFKVALAWRFENKTKNHEDYGIRVLNLAMLHLSRFTNDQVHKLPKTLRQKTFMEVFNHYKLKMLEFKPETQAMFMKRIQALISK